MRYLVLLVFTWGCYYPHHSSYRMEMRVESVVDSTYFCNPRTKVNWEVYGDTLIFDFENRHLVFVPVEHKETPDFILVYMNKVKRPDNERLFIRRGNDGVLYLVRMVYEEGLLVYITAIGQPEPHYMMCFYRQCSCP